MADAFVSKFKRSVSIHLKNCTKAHILINPQVFSYSGYCHIPPQPTVGRGATIVCSFEKALVAARGAVGVMTYDIATDQQKAVKRLAVMFSVPFDYNLYENWLALGVFSPDKACDESLYKLMYYSRGTFTRGTASGTEISYADEQHTLRGTMSPVERAVLTAELWDSGRTEK